MNKQNDKRLKGVGGAIGNSPKKRTRKHPWHIPWRTNCLMCQSPVYHDGQIYWSLCLSHLQETELGPFRKRPALERDNWLQDYIDNPTTKKITCNPDLLRSPKPNIAKVCNRYTQYKFGVNIRDYY